MSLILPITTSEQTVTTTGPVTGVLDTSAFTGDFTLRIRARGLTGTQSLRYAFEDTANASAFSEAQQIWVDELGGAAVEGVEKEKRSYDLHGAIRIGAANNKLRLNVTSLTGGATAYVEAWLEQ